MSNGDGGGSTSGSDESRNGSDSVEWGRIQRVRRLDPAEQEEADVARATEAFENLEVGACILDMFDEHCNHMQRLASARQTLLGLRLVTHQDGNAATEGAIAGECVSFVRLPSDRFVGDARLRCVRALLAEIDDRGTRPSSLVPCPRHHLSGAPVNA